MRLTRPRSRRGATAAEFALTLPLFILFLMSAFEFGWLNVQRHTSDDACYEAARHVHFIAMALLLGFVAVHLVMVALVPKTLVAMLFGHKEPL